MSNIIILNVDRLNFSCEFRPTFFFSFTIKLLYCQKSRVLKFVHLKDNFYRQKVHKKHYIWDITTVTLVFQAVLQLLLRQDGKSPKMAQISLALERFQTFITQLNLKKSK